MSKVSDRSNKKTLADNERIIGVSGPGYVWSKVLDDYVSEDYKLELETIVRTRTLQLTALLAKRGFSFT